MELSDRMDETLASVVEFHYAFDCAVRNEPTLVVDHQADGKALDLIAQMLRAATQECYAAAERRNGRPSQLVFTRLQLLAEELSELAEAMRDQDVVGCLGALTNIQYVLDGAYAALGLQRLKLPAFREVHRSNMSKLGPGGRPIINEAGRVVKGPDYRPPDLARIMREGK